MWQNARGYWKEYVAFFFLFVFWIIITASFSLANIVAGLISSFLIVLLVRLIFHIKFPEEITPLFLIRFPIFLARLAWEVIKANINLAWILIRPRLLIDPKIVRFKTELQEDFRRTIIADTITVTPGTLTLDAQGDELLVHCLAPSHRKGLLEERQSEHLVLWLFGQEGQIR
ncbi:MAG: Na+/H+ antiporter subunit E [Dehalococcoidia bacterium]